MPTTALPAASAEGERPKAADRAAEAVIQQPACPRRAVTANNTHNTATIHDTLARTPPSDTQYNPGMGSRYRRPKPNP